MPKDTLKHLMEDQSVSDQHIEYNCPRCGYRNIWTRDEVLHRGKKEIFKKYLLKEDYYSLPCKNPTMPNCPERYIIGIEREED